MASRYRICVLSGSVIGVKAANWGRLLLDALAMRGDPRFAYDVRTGKLHRSARSTSMTDAILTALSRS